MARKTIFPVDQAASFHISELFFSTTDHQGRILTCNDVFKRIAGYSSEELLGAPHNIIRHPDMPKCVFGLLWEYLLAGRSIGAYVKNMTSSGMYYWVYTLVVPLGEGFLSIRLKPSTETLETVKGVYSKLLETEKSFGADWRKGMEAASTELIETLNSIGIEDYDQFMYRCLRAELSARAATVEAMSTRVGPVKRKGMKRVLHELAAFDQLNREATERSAFLADVSEAIKRIGLNASICAAKMGEHGLALGVLSDQATTIAGDVATEAQNLGDEQADLSGTLEVTSFQVAIAALLAEMIASFQMQQGTCSLSPEQQVAAYGGTYEELSSMLFSAFSEALSMSETGTVTLQATLRSFSQITERFSKILLTTRINHTTGRSIAASIEGGEQYSVVLDEMAEVAESARETLGSLQRTVNLVERTLDCWQTERVMQ